MAQLFVAEVADVGCTLFQLLSALRFGREVFLELRYKDPQILHQLALHETLPGHVGHGQTL